MQLMPSTARRYGALQPFDPEQNIAAGTRYVTTLMWEFHGEMRLVAAAYYAGDQWVGKRLLEYRNPDVVAYVEAVQRQYVRRKSLTNLLAAWVASWIAAAVVSPMAMARMVTVSSAGSAVAFPGKCKEIDDRRSMNQLRAVPNLLTFLRLCMVPFLVLAILDGHYRTAFLLFVIAGISDGLDGLLARALSQRTTLGQYLDPVADKLLLSTLFLVLNHEGLISRRVTVLVFGRDLGILIVGAILFAGVGLRNFKPSLFGKANTFAQVVALVAVLLSQFEAARPVVFIREWALFATVGLTCLSGFDYSIRIALRLGGSPESAPSA